jgi:hypothetical protein
MIPEPDPNQGIEDGIKADGEFLRDVDKGMSSTETGFNIDLGTVRDAAELEHSEVIEEMQQVAHVAPPYPPDTNPDPPPEPLPPTPVVNIPQAKAEHAETIDQLVAIGEEAEPRQPQPNTPPRKPQRPSVPEIQYDHSEAIVQMGRVVQQQYTKPEEATPLKVNPAEMERLTFPRDQHQSQVQGSMEGFINEQAQWNTTVTDLFDRLAELVRQNRLELELIRGKLERINL